MNFKKKAPKIKLAYILSASHSGSTLLAMLLGSHPEICTVGELKFTSLGRIEEYKCSCLENIQECLFWNGVATGMARVGLSFDLKQACTDIRAIDSGYARRLLKPLHRGPLLEGIRDAALSLSAEWRRHLQKTQIYNSALSRCICEIAGKRLIVDSSKVGLRLKYLLRNPDLEVIVIRLIRDGRAVSLTYMDPTRFADAEDPGLRGGGSGKDRKSEMLSMHDAAMEWRRSNEEAESLLKGIDRSRWIEVRYEAICNDLSATMNRIYEFIGVHPADARQLFKSASHHVVGNGMRLDIRKDIRLDERWKEALGREDLLVFEAVAGRLNRRLGYI